MRKPLKMQPLDWSCNLYSWSHNSKTYHWLAKCSHRQYMQYGLIYVKSQLKGCSLRCWPWLSLNNELLNDIYFSWSTFLNCWIFNNFYSEHHFILEGALNFFKTESYSFPKFLSSYTAIPNPNLQDSMRPCDAFTLFTHVYQSPLFSGMTSKRVPEVMNSTEPYIYYAFSYTCILTIKFSL